MRQFRPPGPWRCELLLGPRPLEEDNFGTLEIDPERFASAIVSTLTNFAKLDETQQREWDDMAATIAELFRNRLPHDLANWLRSYVKYELQLATLPPEQFVRFLNGVGWDAELLSSPTFQDQAEWWRNNTKGKDRKKLGMWLDGTGGRGRPKSRNAERIRWRHEMSCRHLRRLTAAVRANNVADVTTLRKMASTYPVVYRLEQANLLNDYFVARNDGTCVEDFTTRLVAFEDGSPSESSTRRIARTRPASSRKPTPSRRSTKSAI